MKIEIADEIEMARFAGKLWPCLTAPLIVYLVGDLGAGKTTLVRSLLNVAGYVGKVKSPTYGLVEDYELNNCSVFHFDLYRLSDPDELEMIGIRDYMRGDGVWFVEWPQLGEGVLPLADLVIRIEGYGQRQLTLVAESDAGEKVVKKLRG